MYEYIYFTFQLDFSFIFIYSFISNSAHFFVLFCFAQKM